MKFFVVAPFSILDHSLHHKSLQQNSPSLSGAIQTKSFLLLYCSSTCEEYTLYFSSLCDASMTGLCLDVFSIRQRVFYKRLNFYIWWTICVRVWLYFLRVLTLSQKFIKMLIFSLIFFWHIFIAGKTWCFIYPTLLPQKIKADLSEANAVYSIPFKFLPFIIVAKFPELTSVDQLKLDPCKQGVWYVCSIAHCVTAFCK